MAQSRTFVSPPCLPISDSASSLARTIARQDHLLQASLEFLQKNRKFLNYGYTVSGKETYEERQQRLYLEVFQAAEIGHDNADGDDETSGDDGTIFGEEGT